MIKWNGSVLEEAGEKGKEKFFKIVGENEDFEGDYVVKLQSGKKVHVLHTTKGIYVERGIFRTISELVNDSNLHQFLGPQRGRGPRDLMLGRVAKLYFETELSFLEIINYDRASPAAFTETKLDNLTDITMLHAACHFGDIPPDAEEVLRQNVRIFFNGELMRKAGQKRKRHVIDCEEPVCLYEYSTLTHSATYRYRDTKNNEGDFFYHHVQKHV